MTALVGTFRGLLCLWLSYPHTPGTSVPSPVLEGASLWLYQGVVMRMSTWPGAGHLVRARRVTAAASSCAEQARRQRVTQFPQHLFLPPARMFP